MKHLPLRHVASAAALTMLLAGCVMAPARLVHPVLRDDVPLAGLPAAPSAIWPDAAWWRSYGDPQLDQLMALGICRNTLAPSAAPCTARWAPS